MSASFPAQSARLVDRLSKSIAARTSRRGFLARTAIGATALSVAPTQFIFRPGSAYAAVCNCSGSGCDCGSLCCDGYTEFCCTLTGFNACPAGTALGGWWRAEGSGLCGGASRYYMDCNVVPDANPCSCGCTHGDCNNRKSCCTHFRYGQCHQEIGSMGAIMCRVVSCTPPWVLDASCTGTDAVDQATAFHDRPCLEAATGMVDLVTRVAPDQLRVAGWAVDGETNSPIDVHVYVDGAFAKALTANGSRPDIPGAIPPYGGNHGYDVTIPVSPAAQTVCVYAINSGVPGPNPVIGCRSVDHQPFGNVDVVQRVDPTHVRVQGWAIDPDSSGSIDVQVLIDGTATATATADVSRPDVGQVYSGYGALHGFDVTVPMAATADSVCVNAINVARGGSVSLGCRPISHLPFGNFDVLIREDPDHARVQGWAIDPDTKSAIDVHIYVNGQGPTVVHANAPRPDVGDAFPNQGPNHGYDVVIPFAGGTVCAYAINTVDGTGNPLLGCRSLSNDPFGSLDLVQRVDANNIRVAGWVIDPDRVDAATVHVYVDNHYVTALTADSSRPDVGAVYPSYGDNHGYKSLVAAPQTARTVCVYGINVDRGSSNPLLGCASIP